MKQNNRKRINSVFLCLALLLCSVWFPIPSAALNVLPGVITPPSGLPVEDDPYILNPDVAELHGHVERLYDRESSLDTLTFRNDDGTVTTYFFTENVKYVASDGSVKDKSNKLYSTPADSDLATLYALTNSDNDVNTYFPASMSGVRGIMLNAGGCNIQLIPVTTNTSAANKVTTAAKTPDYVMYNNIFGNGKHLRYSPTFSGFKEDIILDAPTSESFSFILKTGGLIASLEYGEVKLYDSSGNLVAYMGQIYAYDSFTGTATDNSHVSFNNAVSLTQTGAGDYLLTITPDQNFIYGSKTVYPVYIDPDITVNVSGSGTNKTIVDVPIYNGTGTRTMTTGANTLGLVGYVGSVNGVDHGVGRMYLRFPGLLSSNAFSSLPVETISNVSLYLNEVSGKTATSVISAYQYSGSMWDEYTATYNNVTWYSNLDFDGDGVENDALNAVVISSSGRNIVQFDLTDQMASWRADPTAAQKGIFISNLNETSSSYFRSFASAEYATETNRPYITVKYTTPFYSMFDDHIIDVYTNSSSPAADDGLQYRANCYGYALRLFKNDGTCSYETPYKQDPGEFINTRTQYSITRDGMYSLEIENGEGTFSLDEEAYYSFEYEFTIVYGASFLVDRVSDHITNEIATYLYFDLMAADMKTLGYTVTQVTGTDAEIKAFLSAQTDANMPIDKRLVILVGRNSTDGISFHFYMQHSNGDWSHKNGEGTPSNRSFGTDSVELKNNNIWDNVLKGMSGNNVYTHKILFYVNKPVTIDYGHDANGDPIKFDMAGDVWQNAKHVNYPLDIDGAIDFNGDRDFYSFRVNTSGTRTISVTGLAGASVRLYDNTGTEINCTGAGTSSVIYMYEANKAYFVSVEQPSSEGGNSFVTGRRYTLTSN